MNTQDKHTYGLPIVLVGIAASFFLLFVYGYPRLFLLIEPSHLNHFEKNVADALAEGNVSKALKIARRATVRRVSDPMAYTVYGRVLVGSGNEDEAIEQLNNAVSIQTHPAPVYGVTRKPFYFAPARLTLGKYYLERDNPIDAVWNFELARAYAALADIEYRDFQAALYQAYAEQGLWARALEFGEPSDRELDHLDGRDLVRIARVCEGKRAWKLVARLAEQLLTRDAFSAEARYFLGRIDLAHEEYESSLVHLEEALSKGHSHSAFHLGMALEKAGKPARAIQAFLRTPSGNVYRPFALAYALSLLTKVPEAQSNLATVTKQDLLDQLDQEIAEMRLLQRPIQYDNYRRLTPLAFLTSKAYFLSGGRFPILILWEDGQAPADDPTTLKLSNPDTEGTLLVLKRSNTLLQLQWVENLVNWESVERLPKGVGAIPGWIDTARDWFELRADHVARIQEDDAGNSYLSFTKLTWFYSVPIKVQDDVGYLLAGRLKGPGNMGGLRWQSLDEEQHVLSEQRISNQNGSGVWTRQAGYMRSQRDWDSLRVHLEVTRNARTLAFDDVMLVEINEPDPAFTGVEF